jgi:hypothetical protein
VQTCRTTHADNVGPNGDEWHRFDGHRCDAYSAGNSGARNQPLFFTATEPTKPSRRGAQIGPM